MSLALARDPPLAPETDNCDQHFFRPANELEISTRNSKKQTKLAKSYLKIAKDHIFVLRRNYEYMIDYRSYAHNLSSCEIIKSNI